MNLNECQITASMGNTTYVLRESTPGMVAIVRSNPRTADDEGVTTLYIPRALFDEYAEISIKEVVAKALRECR